MELSTDAKPNTRQGVDWFSAIQAFCYYGGAFYKLGT